MNNAHESRSQGAVVTHSGIVDWHAVVQTVLVIVFALIAMTANADVPTSTKQVPERW